VEDLRRGHDNFPAAVPDRLISKNVSAGDNFELALLILRVFIACNDRSGIKSNQLTAGNRGYS
jgi:hypothetical protein